MEQVKQNNRLIAEFMGWETRGAHYEKWESYGDEGQNQRAVMIKSTEFRYHTSWLWLMPVCTKIGMVVVAVDINKTYEQVVKRIVEINSGI